MTEPTRFLMITPDNLELAVADDHNVVVRLRGLEKEAGLTPGLGVMIVLSPGEAVQFAEALKRTAQKASPLH